MLQTLNYKITRKQRCVYRHPSIGNLGRTNLARVSIPLQKEVLNQIDGSVSVPIAFKSTGFAFEQSFSSDLVNMSTFTALFGSMIRIDGNNINLLLNSNDIQGISEFSIRNFIDNSIDFSSFGVSKFPSNSQILQIFDNDMTDIKLISKNNNLITNLEQSCPDKVIFKSFDIPQTHQSPIAESSVIDTFEFIFPNINFSSFVEDVLSEIELSQDFPSIHDSQSKISSININTHNIAPFLTNEISFDTNLQNPTISLNQSARLENPTIRYVTFKSLEQSIFSNRQNNSFTFDNSRQSKERGIPFSFSVSKHFGTELNRQSSDFLTDFPSIPDHNSGTDNCICSQQSKFIPTIFVGGMM